VAAADGELGELQSLGALSALVASGHAFSVADARRPDFPLVWVNPAFERLTGYPAGDLLGRNCRFLQGPDTDPHAVDRIRHALAAARPVTETLLNYRPDGSTWWNEVVITPVHSDTGELTHFVGVQIDVGDRVRAAEQRDRARAAAESAQLHRQASEHAAAIALQRSLLPVLPQVEGLELAARYIPASGSAEIGGDWYDVLPLPDSSTGIAIGDVMGHDMRAAGAMGQLRSALRSYAWEGYRPAEVIDRLNHLVCGLGTGVLATCVYARLEPADEDRPPLLQWCNAGHPPPLVRTPGGEVHPLDDLPGLLIGFSAVAHRPRPRSNHEVLVPPGSTLLFYTDGLVENRLHDVTIGIKALQDVLSTATVDQSMESLADRLVAAAGHSDLQDDQCLLLVRVQPPAEPTSGPGSDGRG
jgi:PAS domain S-box-containing protein